MNNSCDPGSETLLIKWVEVLSRFGYGEAASIQKALQTSRGAGWVDRAR